MSDESLDYDVGKTNIRKRYAFDLFCQQRFEESLKVFNDLDIGGFLVIIESIQSLGNRWVLSNH